MDWQCDSQDVYTTTSGNYRLLAWHTTTSAWVAEIDYQVGRRSKGSFATLEAAQAWCIAELKRLKARARADQPDEP